MGSRLVAEYDPATSQYYYYTQDQIGSTRIVTDDAGAVVYAAAHDPYGGIQQTWTNAFDPKRKFSDKERDEETGLDYFGARYFANASYRWLSIDPVLITERAIAHSQAWNLYAYCGNNPVTFSDPDGRIVKCSDWAAFEALKRSIGNDTLASKITWDRLTGIVSIEDIKSDNLNFISLKELVKSSQEIIVALVDRAFFQEMKEGVYEKQELHLGYGWNGLVIFPKNGWPASAVHDGRSILVRVARSFFGKDDPEQARTLAEELYGHAFLYTLGAPFRHELPGKDGFVNSYINRIRERKY